MRALVFDLKDTVDISQQSIFKETVSREISSIRQIRINKDRIELYFYDLTEKEVINIKNIVNDVVVYSSEELLKIKNF